MRSVRTGEPVKQGLIGHSKDLSLYLRWAAVDNSRKERGSDLH